MSRDPDLGPGQLAAIRSAGLATLLRSSGDALGVPARHGLALRLTTDAELADLNGRYRQVDGPTDVLAFPGDGDHVGDIAISVERALGQAADGVAELRLLAVHGLLHCLGHDHDRADEAAAMTAETRRLLPGQQIPDLEHH